MRRVDHGYVLCALGCTSVGSVTEAAGDASSMWRTFGERGIYDSPEVWLGQVDVGLPSRERVWHHVVRLHRAVAVVLLDERRVLLAWRHRFIQDRWGWELPGGLVDQDEEPSEAASRELEELTGYRASQLDRLITFQPLAEVADAERVVFVGRDPQRVGEPVSSDGIARVEWVALESVPGLIGTGEIWNAASVVGLLSVLAQGR
jgi:8-oxo-dGTP pyrophosphatase MutT (NUDIX family)